MSASLAGATGMVAATVAARPPANEGNRGVTPLARSYLRHICGFATDAELPAIWADVAGAQDRVAALEILQAHFDPNMDRCHRTYYGHPGMLHISTPLLNLIKNATFRNPGVDPSCPSGGHSTWTHLQGRGERGLATAETRAANAGLDSPLATAEQITRASRVKLRVIVDEADARLELGTMAYIGAGCYGSPCPSVVGLFVLNEWAATHPVEIATAIPNSHAATALIDDVSRIHGEYLNSCLMAAGSAGIDGLGSRTAYSYERVLAELQWGPYRGASRMHASLRGALAQRAATGLPVPAICGAHGLRAAVDAAVGVALGNAGRPQANPQGNQRGNNRRNGGGEGDGGGGGGGDRVGLEGVVRPNRLKRPALAMLEGENTRDLLRGVVLPTLGGATWCKRWYHGGTCFENCLWRGSHIDPPTAMCQEVAALLVVGRNPQQV